MKTKIIITVWLCSVSFFSKGQFIHVPGEYSSIQDAIVAAADGDTVLVDTGTYYENISFLGKAITVSSHYSIVPDSMYIYNTIIDGSQPGPNDSACVVLFNSGEDTTSVLYGFTITGGTGCYWPPHPLFVKMKGGGGIQIINCGAKICHNIITNNHVVNEWEAFGGGIQGADLPENRMIIVEDNQVYNNSVSGKLWTKGGGIAVAFCHTRICDNIVKDNTVIGDSITVENASGGIWYSHGLDYVANVNISGNSITNNEVISINDLADLNWGGGMVVMASGDNVRANVNQNIIAYNYVDAPNVSTGHGILINQCDSIEFSNNEIYGNAGSAPTSYGGGICAYDSQPLFSRNLIYNNSATRGGGICIIPSNSGPALIINNTIYGNDATEGGGVYLNSSFSDIKNTIIWGNSASGTPGIFLYNGSTADVNYSLVEEWTGPGSGNLDTDPLFCDTYSGNFHLTESSPCIDAGDPASPPDPDSSICDMGVFHYDSTYCPNSAIHGFNRDASLIRCYPNPTQGVSSFTLKVSGPIHITLKIYDMHGREVATVVDRMMTAGDHVVGFDASHLQTGVYIYRKSAVNSHQSAVGKLIVVK